MKNFIRDNNIWWGVKIIAATYQAAATLRVFHDKLITAERSNFEAWVEAGFAVLLIDAFLLAILYFLESDEISTYDKFPLVLIGIALAAAVVAIGFADEGATAWMPRIGVLGLILTDVFRWCSEVGRQVYDSKKLHGTREYIEQQIRNEEVLARKAAMTAARQLALDALADEFVDVQIERLRRELGTQESKVVKEPVPEVTNDNVIELNDGHFGWIDPMTNDLVTETKSGKPYTSRGANLAFLHAIKQMEQQPAW